jgi:hypothetical protein
MADKKIDIIIDLVTKNTNEIKKLSGDLDHLSGSSKKVEASTGQMAVAFGLAQVAVGLLGKGINMATGFITDMATQAQDMVDEAANMEKSFTTLSILSERFGVNAEEATVQAKKLGKELRIGPNASAEALSNLLKTGLNLEQATDLMERFTNEAMTGKSANISLSDAVKNLSFAYATNNSAVGNMSGINENFADIIERGKNKLIEEGVALENITEDAAKYRGMIELTNLTLGSAEKFQGGYIDKQAQIAQKMEETRIAIGTNLMPLFTDSLLQWRLE